MPTKNRLSWGRFLALIRTPHPQVRLLPSVWLESLGWEGSSELFRALILSPGSPCARPWGGDANISRACFEKSHSSPRASFVQEFKKKEIYNECLIRIEKEKKKKDRQDLRTRDTNVNFL